MPFISSFDPRRSLLQNGSSFAGSTGSSFAGSTGSNYAGSTGSSYAGSTGSAPLSRTFDRFSSTRKSGVFERPSTYSPTPTLTSGPSKYQSSTLERIKNGTDSTKPTFQPPTSPTSFLSNSSRLSTSSSPAYHRIESTPVGSQRFEAPVTNHQR
jgi:hypothetical protein